MPTDKAIVNNEKSENTLKSLLEIIHPIFFLNRTSQQVKDLLHDGTLQNLEEEDIFWV